MRPLLLSAALALAACAAANKQEPVPAAVESHGTSAPDGGPAHATAAVESQAAASPAQLAPGPLAAAKAIVDAPDRTAEDHALDPGRHPAEMLAFLGAGPGMNVGEIGAGGGYTTELLARAVAPGKVFAQNAPEWIKRFLEKPWGERLQRAATKNVVRVDREFVDPFPPEAKDLDLVLINVIYHDVVNQGFDRDRMNAAVFRALKPGGAYVVIDSAAKAGTGLSAAKELHRIDEAAVRAEVEKAGFKLDSEASFLRNPADTRDWNASPREAGARRGTSDRFALRFVKPR